MIHECGECYRPMTAHAERCDCGCGRNFFPALCCPGCRCGSFEEAHAADESVKD